MQACLDVLCPLLERRYGGEGAEQAAAVRQQLQGVERHMLEVRLVCVSSFWSAGCDADVHSPSVLLLCADAHLPEGARLACTGAPQRPCL